MNRLRPPLIHRRGFIQKMALSSLALSLPGTLMAQQHLDVQRLRNNMHLVTGAGANILVAVGPESVLVVDGGMPDKSREVLELIQSLGDGKPVETLFNTNFRPEHCGLNALLGPEGTRIIAHENTRLWQNNDFFVSWENRHYSPMPARNQANSTFYKTGSLSLGTETADYGFISQFHTDGDIYVHFRDANILFVGDMLSKGQFPLLDYITGGWIGGAQQCTRSLLEMANEQTLLVSSEGDTHDISQLELQQQMLDHAYEKVADAYRTGRSLEQFLASSPMADFVGNYGDPTLFVELLYRGTWYHVPGRAIRGII